MHDIFRPKNRIAQVLYDAFQKEAKKREVRTVEEWKEAEIMAVWRAACFLAIANNLRTLSIDEVRDASDYASGSVDYGSKWAYKVLDKMREKDEFK